MENRCASTISRTITDKCIESVMLAGEAAVHVKSFFSGIRPLTEILMAAAQENIKQNAASPNDGGLEISYNAYRD